jgi:hypothetical protein
MNLCRSIGLGTLIATVFAGSMALAEVPGEQPSPADHSAHHPGQPVEQPNPQMQPSPQMMGNCPMMGGMMGQGMQGMMGSGMMQGGTGPGMGALFGSRVTPMMNLSVEDVRGYLAAQLDRLNNKRLKVGDIKSDEAAITADIVTVDNSLVQRLKVDRHTGAIEYQD